MASPQGESPPKPSEPEPGCLRCRGRPNRTGHSGPHSFAEGEAARHRELAQKYRDQWHLTCGHPWYYFIGAPDRWGRCWKCRRVVTLRVRGRVQTAGRTERVEAMRIEIPAEPPEPTAAVHPDPVGVVSPRSMGRDRPLPKIPEDEDEGPPAAPARGVRPRPDPLALASTLHLRVTAPVAAGVEVVALVPIDLGTTQDKTRKRLKAAQAAVRELARKLGEESE